MDIEVRVTTAREDAIEIAKTLNLAKCDLVISLGGDGTANEIINGLLCIPDHDRPAFASLPGGNANVLSRNLGFSGNPIEAAQELIQLQESHELVNLALGKVDGISVSGQELSRYFTFNAGIGIDAEVLYKMHELRNRGRKVSNLRYSIIALQRILAWTKIDSPSLDIAGKKYFFALILNLSPWTYVAKRAINPAPQVTMNNALSIFASRSSSIRSFAATLFAFVSNKNFTSLANFTAYEDCDDISMKALMPLWLQVDGEPLALITQARFTHQQSALRVYAT